MANEGWIDAHVHVWPERFTAEDFLAVARPAGVRRAVLVQPSSLGYDNTFLLETIRAWPGVFSGIALVDYSAPDAPLRMRQLAADGIRGFRLRSRIEDLAVRQAWECAAEQGLVLSLLIDPCDLPAVHGMYAQFPSVSVVIDHLARIGMDGSIRQADVDALCALAAYPNVYVKLSGFYALGQRQAPYADLAPLAARVLDAFPANRLMWGSDAPFQLQNGGSYLDSLDFVRGLAETGPLLRDTAEALFFR